MGIKWCLAMSVDHYTFLHAAGWKLLMISVYHLMPEITFSRHIFFLYCSIVLWTDTHQESYRGQICNIIALHNWTNMPLPPSCCGRVREMSFKNVTSPDQFIAERSEWWKFLFTANSLLGLFCKEHEFSVHLRHPSEHKADIKLWQKGASPIAAGSVMRQSSQ